MRRILATVAPPCDRAFAVLKRIAAIDAHAGPCRQPVGGVFEEPFCAIGVGQNHAQVAVMLFMPIIQDLIGRLAQCVVVSGQGGINHRQLVGIGADRLNIAFHRDQAIGGTDEFIAQPFHHRLNAPVLP